MVTECIKVSESTKRYIDKRKKAGQHTSRDSALREIIEDAEKYRATTREGVAERVRMQRSIEAQKTEKDED